MPSLRVIECEGFESKVGKSHRELIGNTGKPKRNGRRDKVGQQLALTKAALDIPFTARFTIESILKEEATTYEWL